MIPNGSLTGTKETKECRPLSLVLMGVEAGVLFM